MDDAVLDGVGGRVDALGQGRVQGASIGMIVKIVNWMDGQHRLDTQILTERGIPPILGR